MDDKLTSFFQNIVVFFIKMNTYPKNNKNNYKIPPLLNYSEHDKKKDYRQYFI